MTLSDMETLVETIATSKSETMWNRDILLQYFLTMEKLQENMKELSPRTQFKKLDSGVFDPDFVTVTIWFGTRLL